MSQTTAEAVVFTVWATMSREGEFELAKMDAAQRRVAELMVEHLLAQITEGRLRQSPEASAIDRWPTFMAALG